MAKADLSLQQKYLEQIESVLPAEKPEHGRVSPLDATWAAAMRFK